MLINYSFTIKDPLSVLSKKLLFLNLIILFTRSNRGAQVLPEGGVHTSRDNAPLGQEGHAPQILQPEAGRDPDQEPAGIGAAPLGARRGQGRRAHPGVGPWLQGGQGVPRPVVSK